MQKRSIQTAALNKICQQEKNRINDVNTELYPDAQQNMTDAITLIQRDVKDYLAGKDYNDNHEDYFV